jgi:hypothetical protein
MAPQPPVFFFSIPIPRFLSKLRKKPTNLHSNTNTHHTQISRETTHTNQTETYPQNSNTNNTESPPPYTHPKALSPPPSTLPSHCPTCHTPITLHPGEDSTTYALRRQNIHFASEWLDIVSHINIKGLKRVRVGIERKTAKMEKRMRKGERKRVGGEMYVWVFRIRFKGTEGDREEEDVDGEGGSMRTRVRMRDGELGFEVEVDSETEDEGRMQGQEMYGPGYELNRAEE